MPEPLLPPTAPWHLPALVTGGAAALVLLAGADRALFGAINAWGAPPWDTLWARWTVLGDGLVALALLLPWAARDRRLAWGGLLAALLTGATVHVLKELLQVPRPPAVLPPGGFHLTGPELRALAFPSGHTAAAFAVAGVLVLGRAWRAWWATALALALAAGVGLSRVAVGVHWPSDVLVGAALGWWCAGAALRLAARLPRPASPAWLPVLPFLGAALALPWQETGYPRDASLLAAAVALLGALPALARLRRGTGS